ncbi:MAG: hypothetical protein ACTHK1_04305 [Actinomycetales bacterium]
MSRLHVSVAGLAVAAAVVGFGSAQALHALNDSRAGDETSVSRSVSTSVSDDQRDALLEERTATSNSGNFAPHSARVAGVR